MISLKITTSPRISVCEAGWRFETTLPDYDLWYVSAGIGTISINNQEYKLTANTCIIMPPGAKVKAEQAPQKRLTVFHTHFMISPTRKFPVHTITSNAYLTEELCKRCVDSYRRTNKTGWNETEMCLKQIILLILNDSDNNLSLKNDPVINQLMSEIKKDPGKHWTIDSLAQKAHLSRPQFNRRFANFAGLYPGKFIIQERVKRSIELLQQSGMNVSEVAEVMGYTDVFYFSKQIKRETGHNPSFYKN